MSEVVVTVRETIDALRAAGRYLEWPRPNPARALEIVSPYAECEEFSDPQPGQTPRVRAFVCAVVGDCYRALKEVETAAGWYLRSREYGKKCGDPPFFAPLFAEMVVTHRLVDHYKAALECVHESDADWYKRPLLYRLYWEVFSLWWLRPYWWRLRLRESRVLRELESLARDGDRPR